MKGLTLFGILGLVIILTAFYNVQDNKPNTNTTESQIPKNVKEIVKRSCFDCHAKGAKNMYAKGKLNFDKLDDLTDIKKISALNNIQHMIQSDAMPPEKYIKRNPDKKITDEEKDIISQWVNTELKAIKENTNNE